MGYTINGSATQHYGTFRVSFDNGAFGTEAEASVTGGYGREEAPEFRVSISGIGSHSTELARTRMESYRIAADIADDLEREYARASVGSAAGIIEAFLVVCEQRGLSVSIIRRDGVTVAAHIEKEAE